MTRTPGAALDGGSERSGAARFKHRARLLAKMGLKNNAQLVQYAIEHQLLPDVG